MAKGPREFTEGIVLDTIRAAQQFHMYLVKPYEGMPPITDEARARLRYNLLRDWVRLRSVGIEGVADWYGDDHVLTRAAKFVDLYARRVPPNPTDWDDFKRLGWAAFLQYGAGAPQPPRDTSTRLRRLGSGCPVCEVVSVRFKSRFATSNAFGDTGIRIWEAATGKLLGRLDGTPSRVLEIAFSPDGSRLAAGSIDGTALVWDVAAIK